MRVLVLLAAAVLLAGCVQGDPTTPAAVADILPELGLPYLSALVSVVDPEGGHGEPSLGIAPDGTLFANGDGGRGGGVYRSVDGGATWERIATPVDPAPNFDPDLAVDRDGNVWFSALNIVCTATATSRDLGESWTTNYAACNAPVSDRQYVIPTEGGTAYLYSHQLPTFYQMAAKTTDYGATWIPTAPVEPLTNNILVGESSGWGGGGFWNAATGTVFFTWTQQSSGLMGESAWAPAFALTRDEGASWTVGVASETSGGRLGLSLVVGAADEDGNVYLAWGETLDESTAIYFARSTDDGASWEGPFRVDEGTGSKVFPAITAGAGGRIAVAYYEASEAAYPSDVTDEGTWNVTLAWTDDALAEEPVFQRGRVNDEPVKRGPICINGTTCEGGREFLDYFATKTLPDGRVGVLFNAMDGDTTLEVYAATEAALLR